MDNIGWIRTLKDSTHPLTTTRMAEDPTIYGGVAWSIPRNYHGEAL